MTIHGVENGSQAAGDHLNLNQGVPREHIVQVGECVVDVLTQTVLHSDDAAGAVVRVVVRPRSETVFGPNHRSSPLTRLYSRK